MFWSEHFHSHHLALHPVTPTHRLTIPYSKFLPILPRARRATRHTPTHISLSFRFQNHTHQVLVVLVAQVNALPHSLSCCTTRLTSRYIILTYTGISTHHTLPLLHFVCSPLFTVVHSHLTRSGIPISLTYHPSPILLFSLSTSIYTVQHIWVYYIEFFSSEKFPYCSVIGCDSVVEISARGLDL